MKSTPFAQLECPICRTLNDPYAVICVSCRAFLQNRIPNLDLFQTLWQTFESPVKAFHDIRLAEHKNFAFALFGGTGITLSFAAASFFTIGDLFDTLLDLIIRVGVAGVISGLVLAPLMASVQATTIWLFGGKGRWSDSLGVTAYALAPLMLWTIFLVPIDLLSFGMYQFTHNPHPYALKPVSFVILAALKWILASWAFMLLIIGNRIAHQLPWWKATLSAMAVGGLTMTGLLWIGNSANRSLWGI